MDVQARIHRAGDWIPLGLVTTYSIAIIATPGVSIGDIATLASGHLLRNLLVLLVLGGIVLAALATSDLRSGRKARTISRARIFVRRRWEEDRIYSLVMPAIYLAILLASFSSFKQLILPSAGFGFDPLLAELDRALFVGMDGWQITHRIVSGPLGTRVVDLAYALWFFPMLLPVLLSGFADRPLRNSYLTAFALTWIILGTLLAYVLPAAGPCYFEAIQGATDFKPLMERLASQSSALVAAGGDPLFALQAQEMLLTGHLTTTLSSAGGISAAPSMHVALAVLFTCAGFSFHRTLGWAMAAFAGLIGFGSVHLGWHYAIDGIVGGLGALLIWMAVRALMHGPSGLPRVRATGIVLEPRSVRP